MMACLELLFRHGVQNIFTPALIQAQWREVTQGYRENLLTWIDWAVSGPEALADYARLGWQVRLCNVAHLPKLQETSKRLEAVTGCGDGPCLWLTATPDWEDVWTLTYEANRTQRITTRA
jgi:hypothetical protein